jgi:cytochrome P450
MTSTTEQTPAPLVFNPFDPAFRADPYAVYRRFRDEAPVHESPLGFLVLSRYADCVAMLRSPRAGNDSRRTEGFTERMREQGLDPDEQLARTPPFLFTDPPDHTRLRGLVNTAFTPRVIEGLRPRIQQIVDSCFDAVAERGSMDVIDDLAYPLPVLVICEMMGVPPEDNATFKEWSRELARGLDPDFALPPDALERRQRAIEEFTEYFRALIARRRASPRRDLVSALIAAEDQGQKLSEEELLATCILLLIAGHETTVNLIGNGALALLRHPGELARLRDDPSLIRTAVEECLRYDPPVQLTGRFALDDIELPGGTIRKGQNTLLLLASANRDPQQFADPERFDVAREDNHHIAFGMGIHFCLGAPLARIEGQVALDAFARRLAGARLAAEPEQKENITLRGLTSLSVSFDRIVST